MTRIDELQQHFIKYGSLTKLEAANYLNEFNLKDKINKLIKRGMVIETVMVPRVGRQSYARYTLTGQSSKSE